MSVILSKRGQLKIQQMIFMLVAVTLFFVFVVLFFIAFKGASLQKDAIELNRDKATGLVERISGNPEFIFNGKSNAIDADKLMILKNNEYYYKYVQDGKKKNFWGVKGIIVRKIYPSDVTNNIECTQENYPDCNLIKIFTNENSAPISSFVSLCRKQTFNGVNYDSCELAELMILEEDING
jgi:hypothetical protein